LALYKYAGIPLAEGLESALDIPYTISYAIIYRAKINSLNELPKDKRPPRDLWDKPHKLSEFLDHVWDDKKEKGTKEYFEVNLEDVE
jgi:hypothetical protein